MGIDKVPDQCGFFVLNREGAVLSVGIIILYLKV